MFFVNSLNGFEDSLGGLSLWQSKTPRIRHFYTTTFDLSYLLAVFAVWLWAATISFKSRRLQLLSPHSAASAASPPLPPREGRVEDAEAEGRGTVAFRFAALWSFLAVIPLFAFYLHYCVLSSMYLCDFAPAFAATIVCGMLVAIETHFKTARFDRWLVAALSSIIALLWSGQIAFAGLLFPSTPVQSQSQVLEAIGQKQPQTWPLPDHYELGTGPAAFKGIRNNGSGWQSTGETGPTVVLFVSDLDELALDVSAADGQTPSGDDYAAIRAKVGVEFLKLKSIVKTDHGFQLRFKPPRRAAYRNGIQVVFLSFVPREQFRGDRSAFKLEHVQWKPRTD